MILDGLFTVHICVLTTNKASHHPIYTSISLSGKLSPPKPSCTIIETTRCPLRCRPQSSNVYLPPTRTIMLMLILMLVYPPSKCYRLYLSSSCFGQHLKGLLRAGTVQHVVHTQV